jgi:hypothetical protein
MWAAIEKDFETWRSVQAPFLQQRLDALALKTGESVEHYCDRAALLAFAMRCAGRPVNNQFLVDAALSGLVKERPAWHNVLLGLRGTMSGKETLEDIKGRLVQTEARQQGQL